MRRVAPCYGRGVSWTKRWASVLVVSAFSLGLGACGEDLDDVVSNTPCGDDNQACCPGTTCFHGGQCLANVCRKPVARPSNECRSGDGCPSNGVAINHALASHRYANLHPVSYTDSIVDAINDVIPDDNANAVTDSDADALYLSHPGCHLRDARR